MKVIKITALASKKVGGKKFSSWSLSFGATAGIGPGEDWKEQLRQLDIQLRDVISETLPSPGQMRKVEGSNIIIIKK